MPQDAILKLFGRLPKGGEGASRLQTLLFSATLHSPEIRDLAAKICQNPVYIDLKVRVVEALRTLELGFGMKPAKNNQVHIDNKVHLLGFVGQVSCVPTDPPYPRTWATWSAAGGRLEDGWRTTNFIEVPRSTAKKIRQACRRC